MEYKLVITHPAKRELDRLDPVVKKAIKKKVQHYMTSPIRNAKKLHDSNIGSYRWRVGNYRVVFDVEKDVITVVKISHRSDAYKNY